MNFITLAHLSYFPTKYGGNGVKAFKELSHPWEQCTHPTLPLSLFKEEETQVSPLDLAYRNNTDPNMLTRNYWLSLPPSFYHQICPRPLHLPKASTPTQGPYTCPRHQHLPKAPTPAQGPYTCPIPLHLLKTPTTAQEPSTCPRTLQLPKNPTPALEPYTYPRTLHLPKNPTPALDPPRRR